MVPIERSLDVVGRKAGGDVFFGGVVDLSDISDGRSHAFLWGRHGTVCSSESWLDGLSTWLGNHGFPATRPGNHITARAQEHILTTACGEDARVALLESVFVALALEEGRQMFRAVPGGQAQPAARIRRSEVPIEMPSGGWVLMDQVDLEEQFLRRTPMLKSCPHFLRGRFRHCLSVTSQERCRAKLVGDTLGEERAWKAFGLVPHMLLHKPKGTGNVGKQELMERANKFARGDWLELMQDRQT